MPEYNISTEVTKLLRNALTIEALTITDNTHKHVKHAQYIPGKYHIHVAISAHELKNLSRVSAHRMIYSILSPVIQTKLHALSITILPV